MMNKIAKVGICGHFGGNIFFSDGQTIKTKILFEELSQALGGEEVKIVDTYCWRKKPIKIIMESIFLIMRTKNVIILPGSNGINVFVPLFSLINMFFQRKLHYVVIGGWLPELLKRNSIIFNFLSHFSGIYVETYTMVELLKRSGLNNVNYMPNFKRLDIIDENEIVYSENFPLKLCTFSRVMQEKGIEEAVNAVILINSKYKQVVYTLDIYGQVDKAYIERFENLVSDFPDYIKYKGIINYKESVNVLKDYFALLFPTYYSGEGLAGTIIDAFSAGLPVIATDWNYNREIIKNGFTGLVYDSQDKKKLEEILELIMEEPEQINDMRENCLNESISYSPEIVVGQFIEYLK